jgi:hypothetical protein
MHVYENNVYEYSVPGWLYLVNFLIDLYRGGSGYGTMLQKRKVAGSIPDGVIGIFH